MLVEHKSKGKNLDKAYEQATDYFPGLKDHELPKYILISDFEKLKLYDLDERAEHEFHISEFYENVKLFGFIAGYQKRTVLFIILFLQDGLYLWNYLYQQRPDRFLARGLFLTVSYEFLLLNSRGMNDPRFDLAY